MIWLSLIFGLVFSLIPKLFFLIKDIEHPHNICTVIVPMQSRLFWKRNFSYLAFPSAIVDYYVERYLKVLTWVMSLSLNSHIANERCNRKDVRWNCLLCPLLSFRLVISSMPTSPTCVFAHVSGQDRWSAVRYFEEACMFFFLFLFPLLTGRILFIKWYLVTNKNDIEYIYCFSFYVQQFFILILVHAIAWMLWNMAIALVFILFFFKVLILCIW